MSQEQLEALLGRPLTTVEVTNLDTYLEIATLSLEDMLCTTLENVTETRVFDTREGYKTAFIDIFQEVTEVKLGDDVVDPSEYSVRQWDRRSGSWYNSLVFDDKFDDEDVITVTADWGFPEGSGTESDWPLDLQRLLAALFALISKTNSYDGTVSSKQVEDFRISFNADVDLDEEFHRQYGMTLTKYGLCNIGYVKHGKVCNICGRNCLRHISD